MVMIGVGVLVGSGSRVLVGTAVADPPPSFDFVGLGTGVFADPGVGVRVGMVCHDTVLLLLKLKTRLMSVWVKMNDKKRMVIIPDIKCFWLIKVYSNYSITCSLLKLHRYDGIGN